MNKIKTLVYINNRYAIMKNKLVYVDADNLGKSFKLKSFDGPVIVNIPEKDNNCFNWSSHISITVNGSSISLFSMIRYLDALDQNEKFLKATGVEFDDEYFAVKKFYVEVVDLIKSIMEPHINKHESRSLNIEISI